MILAGSVTSPAVTHVIFNSIIKHTNMMLIDAATTPNVKIAIKFTPRGFIPNVSLTFGQFPDNSVTAIKFPQNFPAFTTTCTSPSPRPMWQYHRGSTARK